MAKKLHYYVLVFTDNGPVYVTSINKANKYAHFEKEEKPLEFTLRNAEDLCFGLCANFYSSVVVRSPIVLDCQPYRYEDFDLKFIERSRDYGEEE